MFHATISYIELNNFVKFFQQLCAYKYVIIHQTSSIIEYTIMKLFICYLQALANSDSVV